MGRFNDSDIGYMDPEWFNLKDNNQKPNPNGDKEKTVHESGDVNTKK
jgi:hypothetical protein